MSDKVKVRIAVAVDKNGQWSAGGIFGNMTVDEAFDCCIDDIEPGEARYVLTAELERPVVIEIIANAEASP